ncbi:phosducin-like protein [Hemicordylus capensis]|uniref:phosducin-like protein n=1 Tax=Hemicordylus capensis TaxID=884348 RepID=UPI00230420F5|nr:phosducin-like protein [Hemicordylus capensis]XP_053138026.1 phosducin-like protein [Hemicordylus capensis]
MTTLDDKLLGEKLQYYYSSSEDEDSEKEEGSGEGRTLPSAVPGEVHLSSDGSAVNTGPKGVINDWRRFKQLETEQREEQCQEMERLIKTLSMTCRSHLDEEEDKQKQKELQEKLNGKLTLQEYTILHEGADDDEEFLQQYRKQRMEEMRQQLHSGQQFRQVFEILSGEAFLATVDQVHKHTLVMIHIYEEDVPGADSLSGCMLCLAAEYPTVKFCRVRSSLIGASARFTTSALPALLVYKGGELVGNFVRITDQLGEDFFAVDLEAFLQECGLLPEKDLSLLSSIRSASPCYSEDSDLEID